MFEVEKNKSLKEYSSMQIGGTARYFALAKSKDDVVSALAEAKKLGVPLFVVGKGSNIIWNDAQVLDVFVLGIDILGFEKVSEDHESITLAIGAGENWDSTVERAVSMHLSGIEAMSAIPGTVGATPVQNVGAYGQEIKNSLVSVEVYDTKDEVLKTLSNEMCQFSYRDSIFKTNEKGRYIILSVTLRLSKHAPTQPKYPGVEAYFAQKNIAKPTLLDIRNAIIEIRKSKLPDPSVVPSCGSFFENPIVEKDLAEKLLQTYPDMKQFPVDATHVKIPAGWLVESCGLKGQYVGKMKLYDKNALVITNPDGASFSDLIEAKEMIVEKVREKFGILLENEPNIIK